MQRITVSLLFLALQPLCALAAASTDVALIGRHEGHGEGHEGHDAESPSGTGHGHGMNHGAFNFTPSGIPWPQCLRDCCNAFFDYFSEPVNHPLCVGEDFYNNATQCVASNCTEFEQGAFAVVVDVECPGQDGFGVAAVQEDLTGLGGQPQDCEGVNNETIVCNNGSDTAPPETVSAGPLAASLDLLPWLSTVVVVGAASLYL